MDLSSILNTNQAPRSNSTATAPDSAPSIQRYNSLPITLQHSATDPIGVENRSESILSHSDRYPSISGPSSTNSRHNGASTTPLQTPFSSPSTVISNNTVPGQRPLSMKQSPSAVPPSIPGQQTYHPSLQHLAAPLGPPPIRTISQQQDTFPASDERMRRLSSNSSVFSDASPFPRGATSLMSGSPYQSKQPLPPNVANTGPPPTLRTPSYEGQNLAIPSHHSPTDMRTMPAQSSPAYPPSAPLSRDSSTAPGHDGYPAVVQRLHSDPRAMELDASPRMNMAKSEANQHGPQRSTYLEVDQHPSVSPKSAASTSSMLQQHPNGVGSLKRPADAGPSGESPPKRARVRPIWARLSPLNPKYVNTEDSSSSAEQINHPPSANNRSQQPVQPQQQMHLHPQNGPLDRDLLQARECLDPKWEKTIISMTPLPSLLVGVFEWLNHTIMTHEASIDFTHADFEIEAKIGTLIDSNTDSRCNLPVSSATIIRPEYARNLRFESRMDESQHRDMNNFLNEACAHWHTRPDCAPLTYKHIRETDYFDNLSSEGHRALPSAATNTALPARRSLRLRTSRDEKTDRVTARIVKIPLSDLHIFNPTEVYDCRISINLEVNLLSHPDPNSLIDTTSPANSPARRKDRLSYRHLAFAIDLTRVDVAGMPPKYELELEMDAVKLREQLGRMRGQQPQDAMGLVAAFVDNATLLMRQRPKIVMKGAA